jgi:hypothetical protein
LKSFETKDELLYLENKILKQFRFTQTVFPFKNPTEEREKKLLIDYTYIEALLNKRNSNIDYILEKIEEKMFGMLYKEMNSG